MEVKKDRDRKAAVSRTERWDGSCEMTRGNGKAEERNEVACWALPSTPVGLAAVDLLWPHLLTCWFFFFFCPLAGFSHSAIFGEGGQNRLT